MVVSNIFYVHRHLGKWSNLTNIFQIAWNHQLVFHQSTSHMHLPPNTETTPLTKLHYHPEDFWPKKTTKIRKKNNNSSSHVGFSPVISMNGTYFAGIKQCKCMVNLRNIPWTWICFSGSFFTDCTMGFIAIFHHHFEDFLGCFFPTSNSKSVDRRNPANQLIRSLFSHDLQGFSTFQGMQDLFPSTVVHGLWLGVIWWPHTCQVAVLESQLESLRVDNRAGGPMTCLGLPIEQWKKPGW